MKINANKIRPGNILAHKGRQWVILDIDIMQPGKGNALIHAQMRDIATGIKSKETWRTQESVEKLRVDEKVCSFLYRQDDTLTFMDGETFEQYELPVGLLSDGIRFLQDGMNVTLSLIDGKAVSASLPATVIMRIDQTEPVVKGQTASSSYKPAMLEGGIRIMVPPHIASGDNIVVNTVDGTYAERAKV